MSTITVLLPEEDLAFLRAYSATQGVSPEALLARQARNLREYLERRPHPAVEEATGIIAPGIAGEDAYRTHLEEKHT